MIALPPPGFEKFFEEPKLQKRLDSEIESTTTLSSSKNMISIIGGPLWVAIHCLAAYLKPATLSIHYVDVDTPFRVLKSRLLRTSLRMDTWKIPKDWLGNFSKEYWTTKISAGYLVITSTIGFLIEF